MWLDDFVTAAAANLDERALEACYARGVTDHQISLYRLGYINRVLPALPYAKDFLDWSHQGAKLDDMLVLPLTNTLGDIKGLQFRHVERDRTGYSDYFLNQEEAVLFGLGQAMPHIWKTRNVFLVEGAFDLFPLQRHVPFAVATLTARVVDSLLRVLRRLVTDIWLGYDNDSTGLRARETFKRTTTKEFQLHDVTYPKITMVNNKLTKDPADLWETWGETKFSTFVREKILARGLSPMETF